MSTIIKRKHLTKGKTPSNNYGHFLKLAKNLKTEAMETSPSQDVLVEQISEKFPRLNNFDGESVQVRQ